MARTSATDAHTSAASGVTSITGTANEVIASAPTGAVTLSTPQAIGTGSSPTFAALSLTAALTVPNGGTGLQAATAYAVLCGGTTTTAALQSVASVGTAGQVLTSNGASALPTFQSPSAGVSTGLNNGYRLVLTKGSTAPTSWVPTADVTPTGGGASTNSYLWLISQAGLQVASIDLYNGTNILTYTQSVSGISLGSTASGIPIGYYDVFVVNVSGTPTLYLSSAWASATARTNALIGYNNMLVNNVADNGPSFTGYTPFGGSGIPQYQGRLVGSIAVVSKGIVLDTAANRNVWNASNQQQRYLAYAALTGNSGYATTSWRQANATATACVNYMCGWPGGALSARVDECAIVSSASWCGCGIGLDVTNANSAQLLSDLAYNGVVSAQYVGQQLLGYHAVNWLEYGVGGSGVTFYYTNGSAISGLTGQIWM